MGKTSHNDKTQIEYATFSIRIKVDLARKIEELAKKENRTRNNTVAWLLEKAVKEK